MGSNESEDRKPLLVERADREDLCSDRKILASWLESSLERSCSLGSRNQQRFACWGRARLQSRLQAAVSDEMDAEEAAAAADAPGQEHPLKCEICSREFPDDNSLANHFEACFQDHCPAETRIDEQAQGNERPTVRHELLLGSRLIPASAAVFLCRLLPPPSLMSLACTSRSARNCTDNRDLWDECVLSSWNALWSHSEDDPSNMGCLCNFQPPVGKTLQEVKKNAILVWICVNLGAVKFRIKTFSNSVGIPVRGVRDASGTPAPVLVHMSVHHLKTLIQSQSGVSMDTMRLVQSDSKQLLHDTAPVGAYLWRQLERGIVSRTYEIRIDMLLSMSTNGCSQSTNTEPLRPDAFHFMANFHRFPR